MPKQYNHFFNKMDFGKQTRETINLFNNLFPLDYWWRQKHNVPLFSEEHLNTSQVAIFGEWMEGRMMDEYREREKERTEKQHQVKQGIFTRQVEATPEETDRIWEQLRSIDFSKIEMASDEIKIKEE